MLKFLRGRKKSRNVLLIFFVAVLALSLVGLFSVVVSGGGAGLFRGTGGSETVIARVGSYEVTVQELKDALANFGQQVAQGQGKSRQDDLSTLYGLYGQQVLDDLIRQKLVLYEANQLNLGASDTELQSRLKQIFAPWPGAEQYRMRLQQAGLTPVRFENDLRASIAQEHMRSFVTAAVGVDPKDAEEDYRRNNTTYTVRWVDVDPQKFRDKIQIAEPDLRAYFEAHRGDFKITAEQRRAHCIFIDQSKAGEVVQISDDELKQDFTPAQFIKRVRVSQIVLNVPKKSADEDKAASDKKEEEIRTKAQDIVQRAQGAEGKPAEDFAKLAREFSEDAKTKAKGGELGWVNKDDKRDTDDPVNRVFNMADDEVSQPIKKGDKYYILKVNEHKTPAFADVRDELIKGARVRKGYSKAVEIATEAEQRFKETKNAEAVVAEINKKFGAQVAVVKDTPFFSQSDAVPSLGGAPGFGASLFELQNPGDIGERMNVNQGFAIAQYAEKREPHDAALEEVKDKVDKALRSEKATELAAQHAREIAKAQNIDELKKIGDSLGLKTEEIPSLTGNDSIGQLVTEANRRDIYKLNPGEITREPIKTDNGVYVVAGLVSRKDADMGEKFQQERKSIEQRLLDEKRNAFFSTYLAMTEKQLKDEGKIKVYDDLIASVIQSSSPLPPTGQPRMPSQPNRPRRIPQGAQGGARTVPAPGPR